MLTVAGFAWKIIKDLVELWQKAERTHPKERDQGGSLRAKHFDAGFAEIYKTLLNTSQGPSRETTEWARELLCVALQPHKQVKRID